MHDEPQALLSVEEALRRLLDAVDEPLAPEEVAPRDALGRVLSAPLRSSLDLPPWDNSAMDGYAVHAQDTRGASREAPVRLRVVGEVRAGGSPDVEVPAGGAVRIATGAPVPPSADAVVPVECTVDPDVSTGDDRTGDPGEPRHRPGSAGGVRAFGSAEPIAESCLVTCAAIEGDHIRRRGSDVRTGTQLLESGVALGPAEIALAAGVGVTAVRVRRRPLVGVLATGDELRGPGRDLGRAGIPDANRPGLIAACRSAGAETVDLGIARDSLDSVVAALEPALGSCDAVVVSGGVSVGPYDVVRSAFETVGRIGLWRVAIQPGKPFAFGRSNPRPGDGRRVLLFGLPGNPVSTLVTFELFVRPVLERLEGRLPDPARSDRAVTEDPLRASAGRRGYVRVTVGRDAAGRALRDERGRLSVRLAGAQGSHVLSALAAADALAIVPEAAGHVEPGEEVELLWLRR